MKLLFYSPVQLVAGGGCERWHCDITNSLKKQFDCDIEIITGNIGDQKWNEDYLSEQLNGISYQKINFFKVFGVIVPSIFQFLFLIKKVKQVDCVHVIHGFMGQDILFSLIKLFTNKKIVIGHHAPIFHSSKIHNIYMKYISRYILKYFDFHQTLNSSDRDFFINQWNIQNVYYIPSGIRIEKFLSLKPKPHKGLTFLSVGRYEAQKGFDLQLKAIARFNDKE
jgi:glycosyltransferase involved in cell wall biosynthesis